MFQQNYVKRAGVVLTAMVLSLATLPWAQAQNEQPEPAQQEQPKNDQAQSEQPQQASEQPQAELISEESTRLDAEEQQDVLNRLRQNGYSEDELVTIAEILKTDIPVITPDKPMSENAKQVLDTIMSDKAEPIVSSELSDEEKQVVRDVVDTSIGVAKKVGTVGGKAEGIADELMAYAAEKESNPLFSKVLEEAQPYAPAAGLMGAGAAVYLFGKVASKVVGASLVVWSLSKVVRIYMSQDDEEAQTANTAEAKAPAQQ